MTTERDIETFLTCILPGDAELGLPAASELNMGQFIIQTVVDLQWPLFFQLLEQIAQEKFKVPLSELDELKYLKNIESAKRKDVRLVNSIITHCLRGYYTHPLVLAQIAAGSVPPFPQGNTLAEDDWSILEPVFERGSIFREVL